MARLSGITESKIHQSELFFSEEEVYLETMDRNPAILAALKDYTGAFEKAGVDHILPLEEIEPLLRDITGREDG